MVWNDGSSPRWRFSCVLGQAFPRPTVDSPTGEGEPCMTVG